MKNKWIAFSALASLLLFAPHAFGRTMALKFVDCDMMAAIVAEGPRHSWASHDDGKGIFRVNPLHPTSEHSFLIRYALDKIPKGQHITNAEWTMAIGQASAGTRLFFWRITAEWGPGVNYQYRMLRPKALTWAVPGARGNSSDRATKPSAIITVQQNGPITVNVTEDVELWYTGAAPNYGWLVTVEDPDAYILMSAPVSMPPYDWELRVTYEPQ
ncbi:MAG: hypothetical protein ABI443_14435 [Chthoniobacterales bacterium]